MVVSLVSIPFFNQKPLVLLLRALSYVTAMWFGGIVAFLEGRDDGPYAVIRAVHKYFQVFLFWTWDSITLSHAFDVSHNQMICFGQCNMIGGDVCHFWGMLKGQGANHQACFLTLQ